MYLNETMTGEDAKRFATARPPFGIGLSTDKATNIEKIEWHCSSFGDAGEDFNEFHLFDGNEKKIQTIRVSGY